MGYYSEMLKHEAAIKLLIDCNYSVTPAKVWMPLIKRVGSF